MRNSSAGAAASAASNDVVDIDPDAADIKMYLVSVNGRSRVCAMCYHATTDLATRVHELMSKRISMQVFILPTHPHIN